MISRFMYDAVYILRNVSVNSHLKWTLNVKCSRKERRLFHTSLSSFAEKKKPETPKEKLSKQYKVLKVWKNITPREITRAMHISLKEFKLIAPNLNLKPDDKIESLQLITEPLRKCGWKLEFIKHPLKPVESEKPKPKIEKQPPSDPKNLVKRPPVVTVMGHVDHGKTTLLDSLRNTFVVQQEFGGITQHIGAFSVEVKPGQRITFIDTPGHAAFTAMRARGAEVTDLVVLVVAADDGIMEQTIESIKIVSLAKVGLVVAVNKIDKPTALPLEKIKEKLLWEGIQVEDHGGDIQLVPISALKKINLDLLTEVILLQADMMNLTGDPTGLVEGVIIESKKEKMGIVATLIVKRGTLQKGKILLAGAGYARVRKMVDENGKEYDKALPSTPVQVFGWREFPSAGDEVIEMQSEKQARSIIEERERQALAEKREAEKSIIVEKAAEHQKQHHEFRQKLKSIKNWKERQTFFFESNQQHLRESNQTKDTGPNLRVLLKGDVYGTLEVLLDIFRTYNKEDECKLTVIEASVGDITPGDLEIAKSFNAVIYAFNVNIHESAKDILKDNVIEIRYHNVLYKLIDDLKEELSARIPPKDGEKIHGEAEVLQNFVITHGKKKVCVAGARCIKGQLLKDSLYRVFRNDNVIHEGKLEVMKNEKTVVKTITKGMECGLLFESFPEKFEQGDKIVSYDMIKVPAQTTWDPGF